MLRPILSAMWSPALAASALLLLLGCQPPPPPAATPIPTENTRPSRREQPNESPYTRRDRRDSRDRNDDRDDDRNAPNNARYNNNRSHSRNQDQNPAFDFYLLNLSWSPEFCYTHPEAAECTQHRAFTLHGLWPQRFDGGYPEHCSDSPGPQDPAQFTDIYPDANLLHHEWQTHGTCSGLDPETFFRDARAAAASLHIPPQLTHLDHQTSMPPQAILSLVLESNPSLPRESLALSCGNNFLTAIELCLDKQLHPISCGAIRSCRANSVRIPPVQ